MFWKAFDHLGMNTAQDHHAAAAVYANVPSLMVSLHELFPLYVQVVLRARVDIAVPPGSLTLLSSKRTQQLLLPEQSTPTCESSMETLTTKH